MADELETETVDTNANATNIVAEPVTANVVPGIVLSPEEIKKRNQRNIALALGIVAFVVIVFLVTILRMGGNVAERTF